jgi:hypothetical protein
MLNGMLGLWLAASAFLWAHTHAHFLNALLCGIAFAVLAGVELLGVRWARWATVVVALWLPVSAVAFPYVDGGTVLNHLVVGLAVLAVSALPLRAVTTTEGGGAGLVPVG